MQDRNPESRATVRDGSGKTIWSEITVNRGTNRE